MQKKPEGKRPFEKPSRDQIIITKLTLKISVCVDWIHLAQDTKQ